MTAEDVEVLSTQALPVATVPHQVTVADLREPVSAGWSERELQVLRLLAQGADTAELARRLCYSTRTVKAVVADVTLRLHARNRTHAVVNALRDGVIELP